MKVSFYSINPNDFASGAKTRTVNVEYFKERRRKKKERRQERVRVSAEQRALREEQLKNRLLEVKCGNHNCKNILEYVYEDSKSEYLAKIEARWVGFKSTQCWLCRTCARIQKKRLKTKK